MAEFAKYYVEFLWSVLQNFWALFSSIGVAIYKFFIADVGNYFNELVKIAGTFDVLGWILLIVTFAINFCLIFFLFYKIFQLCRRYVFFRAKEVEKDKLMEEVAKLELQADELAKEKSQIFALKVNGSLGLGKYGNSGGTDSGNLSSQANSTAVATVTEKLPSRFSKLITIDEKYLRHPSYISMEDTDVLTLSEMVDRFVFFSASQLKLYYDRRTIRQFFSGMATSKVIILEGISGTGKTSLPYAMGKFFNYNSTIISVQPSWRDRADLLGYFNEFTKKFNETDFLSSLYEATYREEPNFIVLDEMNLARIEYYFAEFLSVMEMPDHAEWKVDIVSAISNSDPRNLIAGKLLVPQNLWFVGTANNDDSTFTITDKVYDRAVAIQLNNKGIYFDTPITEGVNCSINYLDNLFTQANRDIKMSDASKNGLSALDEFIQSRFKVCFGNRIMRHIKTFVPVYVASGGSEIEALDFLVATKILRKFTALNLPFLTKELNELLSFFDKTFGKGQFAISTQYIKDLQKNM